MRIGSCCATVSFRMSRPLRHPAAGSFRLPRGGGRPGRVPQEVSQKTCRGEGQPDNRVRTRPFATVVAKERQMKSFKAGRAARARLAGCAAAVALGLAAGGAARAVIWGLIREGAAGIVIGVRNTSKAQEALADFAAETEVLSWDGDAFAGALASADILVNTTPLGMTPKTEEMPPVDWSRVQKDAFVYDIIYTPGCTRFLREAKAHGHRVTNGVAMLVGQGAEALSLWTGVQPDESVMEQALLAALSEKENGGRA